MSSNGAFSFGAVPVAPLGRGRRASVVFSPPVVVDSRLRQPVEHGDPAGVAAAAPPRYIGPTGLSYIEFPALPRTTSSPKHSVNFVVQSPSLQCWMSTRLVARFTFAFKLRVLPAGSAVSPRLPVAPPQILPWPIASATRELKVYVNDVKEGVKPAEVLEALGRTLAWQQVTARDDAPAPVWSDDMPATKEAWYARDHHTLSVTVEEPVLCGPFRASEATAWQHDVSMVQATFTLMDDVQLPAALATRAYPYPFCPYEIEGVTLTAATLVAAFASEPLSLPRHPASSARPRSIVPHRRVVSVPFTTTAAKLLQTAPPSGGAFATVSFAGDTMQLLGAPTALYYAAYAVASHVAATGTAFNVLLPIRRAELAFDNMQGLLATASPSALARMSIAAGVATTVGAWTDVGSGGGGGVLGVRPGIDFPLGFVDVVVAAGGTFSTYIKLHIDAAALRRACGTSVPDGVNVTLLTVAVYDNKFLVSLNGQSAVTGDPPGPHTPARLLGRDDGGGDDRDANDLVEDTLGLRTRAGAERARMRSRHLGGLIKRDAAHPVTTHQSTSADASQFASLVVLLLFFLFLFLFVIVVVVMPPPLPPAGEL